MPQKHRAIASRMSRTRKVAALLSASALLATAAAAPVAQAESFQAKHKCSPGQHGNPHPGFKPGVCKKR